MKKSNEALFDRACRVIPGGVNSPVRAFRAVGGTPRFVQRAQGAYFWDAEEKRYIDYIGSWGPMILGHGHPAVLEAVQQAARDLLSSTATVTGWLMPADPAATPYPATAADPTAEIPAGPPLTPEVKS